MQKNHLILAILLMTSFMFSCDKEDDEIDEGLVGTWEVTKVEGQQFVNGNPGIKLEDENPTGYVKFESDGKGEQNYSFTLFGTTYPQTGQFRWTATASTINVKRFNDSDLVWERELNEPNKQIASFFFEDNNVKYTLTLEK